LGTLASEDTEQTRGGGIDGTATNGVVLLLGLSQGRVDGSRQLRGRSGREGSLDGELASTRVQRPGQVSSFESAIVCLEVVGESLELGKQSRLRGGREDIGSERLGGDGGDGLGGRRVVRLQDGVRVGTTETCLRLV